MAIGSDVPISARFGRVWVAKYSGGDVMEICMREYCRKWNFNLDGLSSGITFRSCTSGCWMALPLDPRPRSNRVSAIEELLCEENRFRACQKWQDEDGDSGLAYLGITVQSFIRRAISSRCCLEGRSDRDFIVFWERKMLGALLWRVLWASKIDYGDFV